MTTLSTLNAQFLAPEATQSDSTTSNTTGEITSNTECQDQNLQTLTFDQFQKHIRIFCKRFVKQKKQKRYRKRKRQEIKQREVRKMSRKNNKKQRKQLEHLDEIANIERFQAEEEFKCSICWTIFYRPVILVNCRHVFCEECLQLKIMTGVANDYGNLLSCSLCRKPILEVPLSHPGMWNEIVRFTKKHWSKNRFRDRVRNGIHRWNMHIQNNPHSISWEEVLELNWTEYFNEQLNSWSERDTETIYANMTNEQYIRNKVKSVLQFMSTFKLAGTYPIPILQRENKYNYEEVTSELYVKPLPSIPTYTNQRYKLDLPIRTMIMRLTLMGPGCSRNRVPLTTIINEGNIASSGNLPQETNDAAPVTTRILPRPPAALVVIRQAESYRELTAIMSTPGSAIPFLIPDIPYLLVNSSRCEIQVTLETGISIHLDIKIFENDNDLLTVIYEIITILKHGKASMKLTNIPICLTVNSLLSSDTIEQLLIQVQDKLKADDRSLETVLTKDPVLIRLSTINRREFEQRRHRDRRIEEIRNSTRQGSISATQSNNDTSNSITPNSRPIPRFQISVRPLSLTQTPHPDLTPAEATPVMNQLQYDVLTLDLNIAIGPPPGHITRYNNINYEIYLSPIENNVPFPSDSIIMRDQNNSVEQLGEVLGNFHFDPRLLEDIGTLNHNENFSLPVFQTPSNSESINNSQLLTHTLSDLYADDLILSDDEEYSIDDLPRLSDVDD
jgi:hypothetical protein